MNVKKSFIVFFIMTLTFTSCHNKKNSYVPSCVEVEKVEEIQYVESEVKTSKSYQIAYKEMQNGIKTVHVKLNDSAGFDAIFDTGCTGMLISLQEAMSLVKSGTLTPDDRIGDQQSTVAGGDVVVNSVYRVHEVTLVDTEGKSHTINDVPVTVVENPAADVLVGNIIIDNLAEYAYTVDFKEHVIVFQ